MWARRTVQFVVLVSCCFLLLESIAVSSRKSVDEKFLDWFLQNGGYIHGIEPADFGHMGRGFAATKNLGEKEKILQIPHHLIFSTKNMHKHLDANVLRVLNRIGDQDVALCTWLLIEKNRPGSFFQPYLDVLPDYVPSLLYYNSSELQELHHLELVGEVLDMQRSAESDYKLFSAAYSQVYGILKEDALKSTITTSRSRNTDDAAIPQTIGFREYVWAMTMFNSRGLRFQGPVYMAPMADIFNYAPHPLFRPSSSGDFFAQHHLLDTDSGITILTDRPHRSTSGSITSSTAAKEQIFEDYGDNTDETYFKYHGFVPDENPFRCVTLSLLSDTGALLSGWSSSVTTSSSSSSSSITSGSASSDSKSNNKSKGKSTGKPLLEGLTSAHETMMKLMEFRRLPYKCVDQSGVLGKGFEVLLIVLSLTEAEANQCVEAFEVEASENKISAEGSITQKAQPQQRGRNWSKLFQQCGITQAEEFLKAVRASNTSELTQKQPTLSGDVTSTTSGGGGGGGGSIVTNDHKQPSSLSERALVTIRRLLTQFVGKQGITTTIQMDEALLTDLLPSIVASSPTGVTRMTGNPTSAEEKPKLHLYQAVKYRLHRKKLLLRLCEQYGASDAMDVLMSPPPTTTTTMTAAATSEIDQHMTNGASKTPHSSSSEGKTSAAGSSDNSNTNDGGSGGGPEIELFDESKLPSLETRIENFNAWFSKYNPAPNFIAAQAIPGFRMGAVATQSFRDEDIYLGVPTGTGASASSTTEAALMDSAIALKNSSVTDLLTQLVSKYPRRDDFHELLFFLLKERFVLQDKSSFWPYLSLLPTYSDMLPLVPQLWTKEEIVARLGPSDVAMVVLDYQDTTAARFQSLRKLPLITSYFPRNVLTLRNYLWATVILDSRSIWWEGKRHLVPMLDFINCVEDPSKPTRLHSTDLDSKKDFALTKAARDYKEGEQVFENYGQPNHIYFVYHGFVLANNTHDCMHLELGLSKQELEVLDIPKVQPILQKLRLSATQPSTMTTCLKYPISANIWAFLTVKTNTFEELQRKQLVGNPNVPGIDSLVKLIDARLATYSEFERADHETVNALLDAEIKIMNGVKSQLLVDRAQLEARHKETFAAFGTAAPRPEDNYVDNEL